MIDKNRLLAITDGIVAIAATIMVLQLVVPEAVSLNAIAEQWPTLLAYIISYAQIFLAWHEHHDSIANAELINHRIFLINCLWLFFITLLPFVTGVIGHSPDHKLSVLMFIAILFLVQLSITIESKAIQKLNKCRILDHDVIRVIRILSFTGYAVAAVGACIDPSAGLLIILALSLCEIIIMCMYDSKLNKMHGTK